MSDDRSAAERLGDALESRGETLAVAESCTGGLLGSTITSVPGSSAYFVGGVLAYADRTKRRLLAVSRESLERHGAVSEPVASAMARHVRDETGADWAVSTTGYAGPTSDDPEIPVGTVYVGIACAGREVSGSGDSDGADASEGDAEPFAVVEHHRFDGTREEVKKRIVEQALESVLERVEARR